MKTRRMGRLWPRSYCKIEDGAEEPAAGGGAETQEAPAETLEVVGETPDDDLGEGNDTLEAGAGTEVGEGNDLIEGGEGNDVLDPGAGKKRVPFWQDRINKLTREKTELAEGKQRAEDEAAALRALGLGGTDAAPAGAEPLAGGAGRPAVNERGERLFTEAEVDERAKAQAYVTSLNGKIDGAYEEAKTADPKFEANLVPLRAAFGDELAKRPDFWEVLTELPNSGNVLAAMAADPDLVSEVLALPVHKLGLRMGALSGEVKAKGAVQISRAPKPIVPLTGQNVGDLALDDPKLPMSEYSKRRAAEREARAKGQP